MTPLCFYESSRYPLFYSLIDGKVLVVGGMSIDTNPKDHFMSYDIESNRWQSLPPMPTPRYATSSLFVGGKLYVIGKVFYAMFCVNFYFSC